MFHERYLTETGARAYANKYERTVFRRLSAHREASCLARALDAADASGTVLDLPCGAGRFRDVLTRRCSIYLPADLSYAMLKLAVRGSNGVNRPPNALIADARRIGLRDRSVDGVAAVRLLHHIPDPGDRRAMIGEFARVSRRFLVVSFLDGASLKQRVHVAKRRLAGAAPSRAAIRREAISEDLRAAGFEPIAFFSLSSLFSGQTMAAAIRRAR